MKTLAPTLHRFAGRCPPRGLTRLGAALRRVGLAPTLHRFAGRCPPRGLTRLGAALRRVGLAPTLRRFACARALQAAPRPEAMALRSVQACAGRLGAADLSPPRGLALLGAAPTLRRSY
ncbi:hypothetical protein NBRC116584_27080 [Hydrogenophaga sp. 5NK40-0174]